MSKDNLEVAAPVRRVRREDPSEPELEAKYRWIDKYRLSAMNPFSNGNFAPVSDVELREAQREAGWEDGERNPEQLVTSEGKIRVPEKVQECLVVHTHLINKHEALESEMRGLERYKFENQDPETVKLIVKGLREKCTHCNNSPALIRRPINLTYLAKRPREMIHSDWLQIGDKGYVLVLMDSPSRFMFLKYYTRCTAANVVRALDEFAANFEMRDAFTLVTDNGPHYCNQLMEEYAKLTRCEQVFTVAYYQWSNGIVKTRTNGS